MRKILQHRPLRFVFLANMISMFGSGMNSAGVTWYILQKTHSELSLGWLLVLTTLPAMAVLIILVLTLLLIRGTKESAFVNGIIVVLKGNLAPEGAVAVGTPSEIASRNAWKMIKHECRRTKECRIANSQEIAALLLFDLRH